MHKRRHFFWLFFILVLFFGLLMLAAVMTQTQKVNTVPISLEPDRAEK